MSDPSLQIRSAQTIKFGLLAARSSEVIRRAEARSVLSADDHEILGKAQAFLRQVANGAEFITSGEQSAGSALESTEALGYAIEPIESLDILKGRGMPDVFAQFADAIGAVVAGRTEELEAGVLVSIQAFFDRLYDSLIGLIEYTRLQPTVSEWRESVGQLV